MRSYSLDNSAAPLPFSADRSPGLAAIALLLAVLVPILCPPHAVAQTYNRLDNSGNTLETALNDGDPINMATGEFYFFRPLADLGGPLPLTFTLHYASFSSTSKLHRDGLPHRFRHNHRLGIGTAAPARVDLGLAQCVLMWEPVSGSSWDISGAERYGFRMLTGTNGAHYYFMDPRSDLVHTFRYEADRSQSLLIRTEDRSGNTLTYEYQTNLWLRGPDVVRDGLGRELRFTYTQPFDTNWYLTAVRDHAGRTWSLAFEWNPPDNTNRITLRAIVRPDGGTNRFSYAFTDNLAVETEPAGNPIYTNSYSGMTVARQVDPLGNTSTVSYLTALASDEVRTVLLNPDGTRRTFVHANERRAVRRVVDEERREARFDTPKPYTVAKDVFTNVADRLGRSVRFGYDADSGKIAARTDPAGRSIQYRYASATQTFQNADNGESFSFVFRDLVAVEYPDGTSDAYARDDRGRLVAFTNQLGAVTRYGYNARGQVTAITNASGGTIAFGYDTSGNLVAHSDADSGTWSNTVDVLGRVTRVTAPDGTSRQYAYDVLDRLTNAVDEAGVATDYRFDLNGNLTQVVHAAGTALARTNAYAFDALNRPVRSTDAAGFASTIDYTWWGAVSNVTLPDGAATTFRYTPARFLQAVVDPAGQSSLVVANAEGLPTGLVLPDGRTASAALDALGRTAATVDPLGRTTTILRDDYERVTNVVDRLGRETRITRDAEGRITALDVAGVGTARHAYNAIGSVTNVTDPRSNAWSFGVSALGRMASIRDPLGRTETFAYDTAGRLAGATTMDGSTVTNRRDARGAITNTLHSDGTSLAFAYDTLGRFAGAGGAAPVALAYDARDLVTNTTFNGAAVGATHDAVGRVATLAYGGAMTVTYAYDLRGLVTQVVDSVSGARVSFAYNANGELTRTIRSNGVVTEFDRDGAGRVTEIRHGAHGTLGMSYDAEDRIARIDRALPLAPESNLVDAVESFTHDAANNLTTAGFIQDARGRRLAEPGAAYRWDGADRLVSISNAAGVVSNVYTATGDLARRIKGAVTTDFVHTWSLPLRPLLVEKRNGVAQRYYVHSPGGTLLYHIEAAAGNAVRFHHHDHLGTTLFLTDGAGAVSDAYAYTAYGRLLRHTGTSEQPFTFLGARGVRAEDGTSLHHMRARWYDARTARFISFDPLWLEMMVDPLQINPYQYVRGSPAMLTDVTGEGLPASGLWKFNRQPWETGNGVSAPRTRDGWIPMVGAPPNPRDAAVMHWLRNRHARPGEYAFLLPAADVPQVAGQTYGKPGPFSRGTDSVVEELLNPPSRLSSVQSAWARKRDAEADRRVKVDEYHDRGRNPILAIVLAAGDQESVAEFVQMFSDSDLDQLIREALINAGGQTYGKDNESARSLAILQAEVARRKERNP